MISYKFSIRQINFNYSLHLGLVPGKKYDLRVLASTSKGWPDYDLPWETFEIPVNFNSNIPSPPEVVSHALNSSGVEVRWRVPDRGTKIIGYKIFYRKQNSSQIGPIIVPPDTNKYVVSGLGTNISCTKLDEVLLSNFNLN